MQIIKLLICSKQKEWFKEKRRRSIYNTHNLAHIIIRGERWGERWGERRRRTRGDDDDSTNIEFNYILDVPIEHNLFSIGGDFESTTFSVFSILIGFTLGVSSVFSPVVALLVIDDDCDFVDCVCDSTTTISTIISASYRIFVHIWHE